MKIGNITNNMNSLLIDNEKTNGDFSFGKILNDRLNNLEELQNKADDLTTKMVTGEVQDIHKVMIASEEAQIALQMTVQIRNKVIEAYQEVSRMQL
ncbi:hypothetical protein SH2C18_12000 [Clostridium sediminicola]|uniref:flagellar hook-basal body complex protein FliE n=1 Tax=Clostridium sediminicola TaxID=3114879 RepID=UPI0031F25F1B